MTVSAPHLETGPTEDRPNRGSRIAEFAVGSAPTRNQAGSGASSLSLAERIRRHFAKGIVRSEEDDFSGASPLSLADVGPTAVALGLVTSAELAVAERAFEAGRGEGRRDGPGVALAGSCGLSGREVARALAQHAMGYRITTDSAVLAARIRAEIGDRRRTLLICGLRTQDGADIVAARVGTALALSESKPTAVVDCNFLRPSIHRLFGLDQHPGTLSVMSGETRLEAALYETGVAGLAVLPAEQADGAPILGLGYAILGDRILGPLADRQTVIFSARPLLESPETLVLASRLDGVILVAGENKSRLADLAEAQAMLGSVRATALGVVVSHDDRNNRREWSDGSV